ncbi:DNA methyltransferase [Cryobacterium sp. 10I1]|uniref:DNA methyltransferase n=1 Tax=unclassified Cryobacterium TaxID=2649013 RepID=UPI002AB36AA4|nr:MULTISPECIES: DNA methyltransferase [unclassified Cryobacterium]MDY7540861.1 DNA methyltransferase [Cryobacterium sp. 5B3]MEA9999825.1 DNA methyltransferase [Cryobacterium sp. RTS3]MEB0002461.1 DNA methyltransferase [Cryobacterium sp. RTC2.1]MEB0201289.1 DNA methyltransferase [Cryobacterium sp. 5I3]MEB0266612.1 DNA methyltransferase [Cryobacterium sp. 10I5]
MDAMRDNMTLVVADIREALTEIPDASLAGAILDPPYGLGLTGVAWDRSAIAFDVDFWRLLRSKIMPGGTIGIFGHSRTFARVSVSVEESGLQVVDTLAWAKGFGHATANRHIDSELRRLAAPDELSEKYAGWETQLRPAFEPIVIARNLAPRQSLIEAIAAGNAGGYNVSSSLIAADASENRSRRNGAVDGGANRQIKRVLGSMSVPTAGGRRPGNLLLEHDEDCDETCCTPGCQVQLIDAQGRTKYAPGKEKASRFFTQIKYSPRAHVSESPRPAGVRGHPTVKPMNLVNWLCGLIVMPGETYLDGFAGSGAISEGIIRAGGHSLAIEREPEYAELIKHRFAALDVAEQEGFLGM